MVANHFLLTLEHIVLGFTALFSKMGMDSQTSWLGACVWVRIMWVRSDFCMDVSNAHCAGVALHQTPMDAFCLQAMTASSALLASD